MTYQRILTLVFLTACINGLVGCRLDPPATVTVEKIDITEVEEDKGPNALDSSFTALLQKKRAEGFDFVALGQEPGWSLDLDSGNLIRFTSYAMPAINSPWIVPITKDNTTTYTTSTESATMEISIVQGSCADVMSGQLYTHAVTVRIKRGADKDFKTFKGCGTFVN